MKHSISDGGLVNFTRLRVRDTEADVLTMLVSFVHQIPVQSEDILFKILLEMERIDFLLLAALEFIPCRKQVFSINNFIKQIPSHERYRYPDSKKIIRTLQNIP